jgi:glycosyltransferase involved in cell wall biosynthesis
VDQMPSVTVVIPAHNEQTFIQRCIASVKQTGWPADRLEILVVDNRSTDNTAALAASAGARVVAQDTGRIGAIRNAGLRAARGDYIAYVDGDCTVAAKWLHSAVALFEADSQVGAVGGPCLSPTDGTWVERAMASCKVSHQGAARVDSLATSSFIARRALLNDAGMFDEALRSGEDDDMSRRIRSRGFVLMSASDCHVVHYGYPRTWWDLVRKQIWHGSNQLETSTGLDLTLLLTHLFLLAWLAAPLLMVALVIQLAARQAPGGGVGFGLALAAVSGCVPPLFFALKKLRADARNSAQLPQWLAIGFAYFAGRSVGLVQNYWRRLRN